MKQKIFLFDIGNVLMNFDFQILTDRMAADSGRPVKAPTDRDIEMYCAVEKGLISDSEYIRYLNVTKGLSWTTEDYVAIWASMFSVNSTGRELFTNAVSRGLPVYTISNIAGHHMDAIEQVQSGFFDGASGLFLSYQLGVRKPHPDIYHKALNEIGVSAEQCLFIDDLPENVEAACKTGIQAHLFTPETHTAVREAVSEFFDQ